MNLTELFSAKRDGSFSESRLKYQLTALHPLIYHFLRLFSLIVLASNLDSVLVRILRKMHLKNWKLRSPSFIEFAYKVFYFLGLWREGSLAYRLFSICYFAVVFVFLLSLEFTFFYQNLRKDVLEIIKTFGTVTCHIICLWRVVFWFRKKNEINRIVEKLDRNTFSLDHFYITDENKSQVEKECVSVYWSANLESYAWFIIFTVVTHLSFACSCVPAFLIPIPR